METSRSEDASRPEEPPHPALRISPTPEAEEVAAIVSAIGAHLADLDAAAAEDDAEDETTSAWQDDAWRFAGRLVTVGDRERDSSGRLPDGAPHDAWTATARTDRF